MIQDPSDELLGLVRRAGDAPPDADRHAAGLLRRRFGLSLPLPFASQPGPDEDIPVRLATAHDGAAIAANGDRGGRLPRHPARRLPGSTAWPAPGYRSAWVTAAGTDEGRHRSWPDGRGVVMREIRPVRGCVSTQAGRGGRGAVPRPPGAATRNRRSPLGGSGRSCTVDRLPRRTGSGWRAATTRRPRALPGGGWELTLLSASTWATGCRTRFATAICGDGRVAGAWPIGLQSMGSADDGFEDFYDPETLAALDSWNDDDGNDEDVAPLLPSRAARWGRSAALGMVLSGFASVFRRCWSPRQLHQIVVEIDASGMPPYLPVELFLDPDSPAGSLCLVRRDAPQVPLARPTFHHSSGVAGTHLRVLSRLRGYRRHAGSYRKSTKRTRPCAIVTSPRGLVATGIRSAGDEPTAQGEIWCSAACADDYESNHDWESARSVRLARDDDAQQAAAGLAAFRGQVGLVKACADGSRRSRTAVAQRRMAGEQPAVRSTWSTTPPPQRYLIGSPQPSRRPRDLVPPCHDRVRAVDPLAG